MTEPLCTVDAAAERLKLHNKTILRFIREGRLRATKVGKQYRILQSDLDAFTGADTAPATPSARVTTIVDVLDVDRTLLNSLTATMVGAGTSSAHHAHPVSIDIAHDPVRRAVKIIAIGAPSDVAALLTMVDACLEAR